MLAQNFMTALALGISDVEHDALIKVLGMLERGELVHAKFPIARMFRGPNEFNMAATLHTGEGCGTIACLGGWAYLVSDKVAFAGLIDGLASDDDDLVAAMPINLRRLFGIGASWSTLNPRTPEAAAIALRSYLSTGEPSWAEAMALSSTE